MTEAETVPDDVRKLAARFAAWHSANKISTLIESAIMLDRATPGEPAYWRWRGVPGSFVSTDWTYGPMMPTAPGFAVEHIAEIQPLYARRSRDPGVEGLVKAVEDAMTSAGQWMPTHDAYGDRRRAMLILARIREALTTYRSKGTADD